MAIYIDIITKLKMNIDGIKSTMVCIQGIASQASLQVLYENDNEVALNPVEAFKVNTDVEIFHQ